MCLRARSRVRLLIRQLIYGASYKPGYLREAGANTCKLMPSQEGAVIDLKSTLSGVAQVTLDNLADREPLVRGVHHETVTYQLVTVRYWLTVVATGTGNQGLIPENRPER